LQLLELVEKRFPSIQSKIDYMEISTPLTWRDYTGTPHGSMYGIQKDYHHPLESQILPKTKIPKLLFTGQNINIHGVMGVTAGAVMTCGEIIGTSYLIKKIRNG
jgi:all-trans-retinol 13,14-reductase